MGLLSRPICGISKWGRQVSMATPGRLVQVMADTLGVSKATVTQYDRVLAENGLRSKSGRGTSAAQITSRDAVNLLIALAASPILDLSAKDAAASCEAYASLRRTVIVSGGNGWGLKLAENFAKFGLPTLANLPKGHSFGEALSALIGAAGRGEAFKLPGGKRYSPSTFEIRFIGPRPMAEILVVDGAKDIGLLARLWYFNPTKTDSRKIPDLRRTSTVGFRTIESLGSLISGAGTVRP
jgi:hypothetical protein